MKKNLLTILTMLALMAGGNAILAQWAQYNADALPEADATVNINEGASLLGGSSEIIVDPDDATNNLWKYNVDLDAADELKYSWYPSYWDQNAAENTPIPAPSTIACKFKWIDTANTDFGPDLEIREQYKVQAKVVKKNGLFFIRVKDWAADSSYSLYESFDPTEWHVLRLTSNGNLWSVYLDENPTEFASGVQGKTTGKHLALFSAFAENGKSGIMIDWMGYLEGEASSPTVMPLPAGIFEYVPGTSIEDQNASVLLNVYPNPASNLLTISIGNDMVNSQYELVNITGKVVQRGLFNKQINQVDVSTFNSGMYFVKIISGEKVISESFIVR